jgi:hypothetical protein
MECNISGKLKLMREFIFEHPAGYGQQRGLVLYNNQNSIYTIKILFFITITIYIANQDYNFRVEEVSSVKRRFETVNYS